MCLHVETTHAVKLYHKVIKFFNEYTFLNAAVNLAISDTLIKGASC